MFLRLFTGGGGETNGIREFLVNKGDQGRLLEDGRSGGLGRGGGLKFELHRKNVSERMVGCKSRRRIL